MGRRRTPGIRFRANPAEWTGRLRGLLCALLVLGFPHAPAAAPPDGVVFEAAVSGGVLMLPGVHDVIDESPWSGKMRWSGAGGVDLRFTWAAGEQVRLGLRAGMHFGRLTTYHWCDEHVSLPDEKKGTLIVPTLRFVVPWRFVRWSEIELSTGASWPFPSPDSACATILPSFSASLGQLFDVYRNDEVALGIRIQVDVILDATDYGVLVEPTAGLNLTVF